MIITNYVLKTGNAYLRVYGFGHYELDNVNRASLFETEEEAKKCLSGLKVGNMVVNIVKRTIAEDEELPEGTVNLRVCPL